VPLTHLRLHRDSNVAPTAHVPPRPTQLVDGQRRKVSYLRLSVTDRCSFRCVYCMPAQGVQFAPRPHLLTFEEIERIVSCFVQLGISKVRLTGGEPLLRRDIVDLVRRISEVDGVEDLAMTTNGAALDKFAVPLRQAGLKRLNVSIDSLRPDRFAEVTRTGDLERVLRGLDAAAEAGFTNTKLNAVMVRGFNEDELGDLVRFAADRDLLLRFIEYMPIGSDAFWSDATFLPTAEMLAMLAEEFIVDEPQGFARDLGLAGGGPATYRDIRPLNAPDAKPVKVGFISALSHNFCSTCNRVRLTSTGTLQECLAYMGSLSLRDALRAGASDADIVRIIEDALWTKGPGHRYDDPEGPVRTPVSMSAIGG